MLKDQCKRHNDLYNLKRDFPFYFVTKTFKTFDHTYLNTLRKVKQLLSGIVKGTAGPKKP